MTIKLKQVHKTGATFTGARHAKSHAMKPSHDFSAVPTGHALTVKGLANNASVGFTPS